MGSREWSFRMVRKGLKLYARFGWRLTIGGLRELSLQNGTQGSEMVRKAGLEVHYRGVTGVVHSKWYARV